MLSSGLYSSEATLRQGDTNCWWGQAKKVSASDELPIHLRRQCSWAQLVVQVGNANWKNSELHQGIPHLLFPHGNPSLRAYLAMLGNVFCCPDLGGGG